MKHILIVAHGISVAHVITYYEYYAYVYIQSTRCPHLARVLGPGKITKSLQTFEQKLLMNIEYRGNSTHVIQENKALFFCHYIDSQNYCKVANINPFF